MTQRKTVIFEFEADDPVVDQVLALVRGQALPGEKKTRRAESPPSRRKARGSTAISPMPWGPGVPEYHGNYEKHYKARLSPAIWELMYVAAESFEEEFTVEGVADALAVDPQEVRSRLRALGRSKLLGDLIQANTEEAIHTQGSPEPFDKEDVLPWLKYWDGSRNRYRWHEDTREWILEMGK
jgi:hypothetical protein